MFRQILSRCMMVSLLLPLASEANGAGPPARDELTAKDRLFLQELLGFLFDPSQARRVVVKTTRRDVWAGSNEVERAGWLMAARGKQPARIYFTDGDSILAPKEPRRLDFFADCQKRYRLIAKPVKKGDEEEDFPLKMIGRMRQTAIGAVDDSDLVLAAWLYRLGQERLAARALALVPDRKKAVAALREELAWSAFAGLVHAYMVRADEEALAHGERLLHLYPEAVDKELKQSKEIVKDLQRRKKNGTFGKAPGALPKAFERWEVKKKIAYLIDALEEVDARQWSQPGGVDLGSDSRVQALIALGDAAVPALIDVIEKDKRLTRSVHFWRDFSRSRTVLAVPETALTAVMSILRVQVFHVVATGDNFTSRGEEGASQVVQQLRAYWKEYGRFPFDERMMKVLTNPKAKAEAWREAATNLAHLGEDGRPLNTTWGVTVIGGGSGRKKANLAIVKFRKPTTAEAVLAAMDRDLAAHDAGERDGLYDYRRRQIENVYIEALIELNDRRMIAELVKRAGEAEDRLRRKWAYVCHWIGDSRPLGAFAKDFALGKVKLPVGENELRELAAIVRYLTAAATPESDRALRSLAEPVHPAHKKARKAIVSGSVHSRFEDDGWYSHPFCLDVLRPALEDASPTGATCSIENSTLLRTHDGGSSGEGIPAFLTNPQVRKNEAKERVCDQAAVKIQTLVMGVAPYHPLLKDADTRLKEMKVFLDRYKGRLRPATPGERQLLELSFFDIRYVPAVAPLDRAATAADVKAGRAVFHLGGKGKRASQRLPASALLEGERDEHGGPARVLVVQAEVGPGGVVTYGVIGRSSIQSVPAKKLSVFRMLPKPKPENPDKQP